MNPHFAPFELGFPVLLGPLTVWADGAFLEAVLLGGGKVAIMRVNYDTFGW